MRILADTQNAPFWQTLRVWTAWPRPRWSAWHTRLCCGLAGAAALLAADPALAGWAFWVAVVAVVAAAVFALPAVVAWVTVEVAAAIVYVALGTSIAASIINLWSEASSLFGAGIERPAAAAAPEPTAIVPISMVPGLILLPGNAADALVGTVNGASVAVNMLAANAAAGIGDFKQDLAAYRDTMVAAQTNYDQLAATLALPDILMTQASINQVLADISTNGLPQLLGDALLVSGLSAAEIQAFTTEVAAADIRLAVPALSIGQVFGLAAGLRTVPEPGSLGLVGLGLALFAGVAARRRINPPSPAPSPSCT